MELLLDGKTCRNLNFPRFLVLLWLLSEEHHRLVGKESVGTGRTLGDVHEDELLGRAERV